MNLVKVAAGASRTLIIVFTLRTVNMALTLIALGMDMNGDSTAANASMGNVPLT